MNTILRLDVKHTLTEAGGVACPTGIDMRRSGWVALWLRIEDLERGPYQVLPRPRWHADQHNGIRAGVFTWDGLLVDVVDDSKWGER